MSYESELKALRADYEAREKNLTALRTALADAETELAEATAKRKTATDVQVITEAARAEADAKLKIEALTRATDHKVAMTGDEYRHAAAPVYKAFYAETGCLLMDKVIADLETALNDWEEYMDACRQFTSDTRLSRSLANEHVIVGSDETNVRRMINDAKKRVELFRSYHH